MLEPDSALGRIGIRDGKANAFEQKEALQKCHDIFASLDDDFVHRIDASRSPDEVHAEILSFLT